ncbi:MAG: alpha/beta hydrolase [Actinomycetes bacterium]
MAMPIRNVVFTTVAVATFAAGALGTAAAAPAPSRAPSATVAGPLASFYNQRIAWTDCGTNLQCGTVTVPLDYSKPKGMTINLAVNRLVTAGLTAPSLVINPGGPGGSGVDLVAQAGATLLMPSTPSVQGTFNVVGFDPRGVGASLPLVCMPPDVTGTGTQSVPVTKKQIAAAAQESKQFSADCLRVGKGLISNIGTEMVARDLDIIRAALGEPKLTYLGMSYGTYLGSEYAHLFPTRVGRMVLDGVEAPTGGFAGLMKSQVLGFEDALKDWAANCAARQICPVLTKNGTVPELITLVESLSQQLATTPAPVTGGQPITQAGFISMIQYSLTLGESAQGWEVLDAIVYGMQNGKADLIAPIRDAVVPSPNEASANVAVQCYDRPVAGTAAKSVGWSKSWATFSPVFGPLIGWGAQPCFTWPVRQGQPHLNATPLTKAPVLLIGGTHDPNTPYEMAKKTAPMWAAGRLLTWTGYGHVASNRGIPCVNNPAANYLINGVLPADGTVCVPDSTPPPLP